MAFADPIGDMITRIRNAQMRKLSYVLIPSSKFRAKILDVLKQEGYILDYTSIADKKYKGSFSVNLMEPRSLKKLKEYQNQDVEFMQKLQVYQEFKMA